MTTQARLSRPMIAMVSSVLLFVAVVVCVGAAKKLGYIEPLLAKRLASMAIGMVLVVAGNFVPKLRLFDARSHDPARAAAAGRFAGWILVLAGLAIIAIWAFAPSNAAVLASSLVGLGAFVLTGAAWAWLTLTGRAAGERETDGEPVGQAVRGAMVYVLVGLFWAFAIFFADYFWGDSASQWMAIAFAVIISAAPAAHAALRTLRR